MDLVTVEDVRAAAGLLAGVAVRTPVIAADWAGPGGFGLKLENRQPVGAFKIRGAYHAIARLPEQQRTRGVVTHSSGNHGQAVAYAARALGIPAVIVMPQGSVPLKLQRVRELGAEVVEVPVADRLTTAEHLAASRGLTMIPPYDHPDVIAGQGTVGLEIVEDVPDVEVVLAPVGGGGLISGVATAVKALRGSCPELAGDARDSFRAGELHPWTDEQRTRTIADGLRTAVSELTLAHIWARVDDIVAVSEQEIRSTVAALHAQGVTAEPSGAVTTAAYLHHRDELPRGSTVAVVSGGNIDPALLRELTA